MNARRISVSRLRAALAARRAQGSGAIPAAAASSSGGTGAPSRPAGRGALAAASATLLAALVVLVALFVPSVTPAAASGCPNEAIRVEQGEATEHLPDCRAYEMVSPLESSPRGGDSSVASADGNRITYQSWNPYTGQENEALQYVSVRGPEGWSIYNPAPAQNGGKTSDLFVCSSSFAVTPELDHVLLIDGIEQSGEGEECLGDEPPLVPGEPRGVANIFRTDPQGSSYELVNQPPEGVNGQNASLKELNQDAEAVAFTEEARLTPEAPELAPQGGYADREEELYLWGAGKLHYVGYLPDGTPTLGYFANAGKQSYNIADITHGMSEDGERVVFEVHSKLYLRVHALQEQSAVSGEQCTEPAKACTIPIDASEEGPAEAEYTFYGNRRNRFRAFVYATPDDSRIFFVDDRKLTPDSTAVLPEKNSYGEYEHGKDDLYEYDVETGKTTDLTVNGVEPADVRGFVGGGGDSPYIYFVASGSLTGSQQNSQGATAAPRAEGTGTTVGSSAGHGNLTSGSTLVTAVSVEEGEFAIGQEVEGRGVKGGTMISGCSPSCANPTELTLSLAATETVSPSELDGLGEYKVTNVNTTSGAFRAGMKLFGTSVFNKVTEIKAVGSGTLTLSQRTEHSETAHLTASAPNLYVFHEGTISYIATLSFFGDEALWQESQEGQNGGTLNGRTSGNGRFLAFPTAQSLTGFDNAPAGPEDCGGGACAEIYLYNVETNQLSCASCSQEGEAPTSNSTLGFGTVEPLWDRQGPRYMPRNVTENGTVFFGTSNALLPQDTNSVEDVYEYENGQQYLISSGVDVGPSQFYGASADGSNVFFGSGQGLVTRDSDNSNSLYDARIDGGYVEPPALPGCEGEACRGAGTAAGVEKAAGTPHFEGPGNQAQRYKLDCTIFSGRAKKFSQTSKNLRREARKASAGRAARLLRESRAFAVRAHAQSKKSKQCKRTNAGAGK